MKRHKLPHWKPERKYYKGFSIDKDICLWYKNGDGEKRCERLKNFPFYFLIRRYDFENNKKFLKDCLKRRMIQKLSVHPYDGLDRWVRVYINRTFERRSVFDTFAESGEWNRLGNAYNIVEKFEEEGIVTYEADLSLLHRFLCDNDINIDSDIKPIFFDFETDDTKGGFSDDSLRKNRVLSFAYYDMEGNHGFYYSKSNNNSGEGRLLEIFCDITKKYDCLVAWNGANFDFKVARFSMKRLGIVKWNRFEHSMLHSDLMLSVKRNSPAGEFKSYSLANVGERVLDIKKIELPRGKKMIDIYKEDKPLLKRYNMRDAEIMYKLEKSKGYFKNDIRTAMLGNRFSNYFRPSQKVEGAVLKWSNTRGYHYPTHKGSFKQRYPGGYVQEPVVGMHKGVGVFDYKGLYVTIFQTMNISHDTFLNLKNIEVDSPNGKLMFDELVKQNKAVKNKFFLNKLECSFRTDYVGVIPEMIAELNKKRDYFEKLRSKEKHGSEKYYEYYWASASHKYIILSFYGELGNYRGRFFNVKMASAITLTGQFLNKYASRLAKREGYRTLASDTDSIFTKIQMEKGNDFLNYVHRMIDKKMKKFNAFPGHVKLEFEDYYKKIIFCAKKRYVGALIMEKGKKLEKPILKARGFEVRRTDVPDIGRLFQEKIMNMLVIQDCKKKDIIKEILKIRKRILLHKVKRDEIICRQGVSMSLDSYEKPIIDSKTGKPKLKKDGTKFKKGVPIHVRIAKRLKKEGKEFFVGMQIPYIITSSKPVDGVHEDEYDGKYDETYYFNEKTLEPVKRILEVVYPKHDWEKYYVNKKKKKKKKEKQLELLNEL